MRGQRPPISVAAKWGINVYVVEDVLIDAATRHSGGRILRELEGRVNAHALTHAHPDHQGASHEVCEALGIPFWSPRRTSSRPRTQT